MRPSLQRIHADFGTRLSAAEQDPQTLEDLLSPLLRLATPVPRDSPAGGS